MTFSKEFLSNPLFSEQPVSFRPVNPMRMHKNRSPELDEKLKCGAVYQENGDILFRIWAPNASTVSVTVAKRTLELTKQPNGAFEGLYPYDETYCGPHSMDVIVDGDVFIDPYLPIYWHRNRPVNFIEVPDPETDYCLLKDVPHGAVTYETYWSKALGQWLRCTVYTPAGARTSGEKYPVLYLQHGATEDETVWLYNGRMNYIMDNLIAEGRIVPMIVVMNDGMIRYPDSKGLGDSAFKDNLVGSCIPFIEANYPVKTDKWSRAIAGLSMGSGQCASTAYSYPEMFGYIGMFSGRADLEPEHHGHYYEFAKDTENFAKQYKVYFRGMGDHDETSMFTNWPIDDAVIAELGIDKLPNYIRKVYPNGTHEFGAWRRMLKDYTELLFR